MRVIFAYRAIRDLRRIQAYIARDNPSAALRMAYRLDAACNVLVNFPDRGRRGREPGTRELTTVPPYIIVYRVQPDCVEIARIWHGRQDR